MGGGRGREGEEGEREGEGEGEGEGNGKREKGRHIYRRVKSTDCQILHLCIMRVYKAYAFFNAKLCRGYSYISIRVITYIYSPFNISTHSPGATGKLVQ